MATIVGITDSDKILTDASVFTEPTGFQILSQTYVTTRAGLASIVPQYLDPHPDFPTMAVDTINTSNIDGGLAQITITYVGLLSKSGQSYIATPSAEIPPQDTVDTVLLPPPTISLMPKQTELHFPFILTISCITKFATQDDISLITHQFGAGEPAPVQFRGVPIPQPSAKPYVKYEDIKENIGLPNPGQAKVFQYNGIRSIGAAVDKKGFFALVSVTYHESFSKKNE
jgi:hypothetical protein